MHTQELEVKSQNLLVKGSRAQESSSTYIETMKTKSSKYFTYVFFVISGIVGKNEDVV